MALERCPLQQFEKRDLTIAEIYYSTDCDSWIVKDFEGQFHRAPWPNAYRNPSHPHHTSREEVEGVLRKCSKLRCY